MTSSKGHAVVVDAERLAQVLARVAADVTTLRRYASMRRDQLRPDPELNAVKYLFVTAIEGCIDAAQHVCASEGLGAPATNADAMRILARHGVISPALADRIAAAVGFRNTLVHRYGVIDDEIVVASLGDLDDLDEFVAGVSSLIA